MVDCHNWTLREGSFLHGLCFPWARLWCIPVIPALRGLGQEHCDCDTPDWLPQMSPHMWHALKHFIN